MNFYLTVDASKLTAQVNELLEELDHLDATHSRAELARDFVLGGLDELLADIVLTQNVAAHGAGGSDKVFGSLSFGPKFDGLMAALRAGNFDN
jgi:dsDNA-specific endonuclease/ATPase MutS2